MRCLNCGANGIPLDTMICPKCGVHLPSLLRDVLPHDTLLDRGKYCIDYALRIVKNRLIANSRPISKKFFEIEYVGYGKG